MSQNINLLGPAFRKQRRLVTLATVAQCLGVVAIALLGYFVYLEQQVGGLTAELRNAEGVLRSQQGYVEKLKGGTSVPKPDAQLDAEIAQLEAELKIAREAMAALKGGAFGNQQGFAEYLRAFSRQSLGGLWLTGFNIGGSGELEIRGRVLSPDLVPSYLQRLNRERVLEGRSFARLEMSRPKPEPVSDRDRAAGKAALTPRYLEFSLVALDAPGAEKTP
jgi:HPt (histidine-containing phosphotransfer) domain-containing protein